jgi:hypothetical protein
LSTSIANPATLWTRGDRLLVRHLLTKESLLWLQSRLALVTGQSSIRLVAVKKRSGKGTLAGQRSVSGVCVEDGVNGQYSFSWARYITASAAVRPAACSLSGSMFSMLSWGVCAVVWLPSQVREIEGILVSGLG